MQIPTPARPPRYKLALPHWVGAYAANRPDPAASRPDDGRLATGHPHLAISALMVAALTWLVIPTMTGLFRVMADPRSPRTVALR